MNTALITLSPGSRRVLRILLRARKGKSLSDLLNELPPDERHGFVSQLSQLREARWARADLPEVEDENAGWRGETDQCLILHPGMRLRRLRSAKDVPSSIRLKPAASNPSEDDDDPPLSPEERRQLRRAAGIRFR